MDIWMEKTKELESYIGKKVYVKFFDNRNYSGEIRSVMVLEKEILISLIDNKNHKITFNTSALAYIQEED